MFNNIPSELKGTPNWVCWKSIPDEKSHSGIKKIPINPQTGGHAMSNNPITWSDFDTAVRESVKYQGIGYMFTNSPFFGVDIDDCREAIDDYNNGGTNNIVYDCISGLQSYSELSQSGNGIHIICKGELPKGARRKGKVEMYDHGRFFIMTGNSCSEYANIAECTEAIKPLYQKYLGETKKPVCKEAKSSITGTLTEEKIIVISLHFGAEVIFHLWIVYSENRLLCVTSGMKNEVIEHMGIYVFQKQ